MRLICVDEQNFLKIRQKNGVYVDKTKHLYDLFKDGTYFFIARPRRFGKSLLCSTVAELFAGNKELFKGLWIEKSDWPWDKHPVIYMDMTMAASPTADATTVKLRLQTMLLSIAEQYDVDLSDAADRADMFGQLIKKLHAKTGIRVAVIIDEYDKPLLDVLHHPERYPSIHDELRDLYAQLKANSEHLRFVFLTGVFKFAQTSVFSGLNNITDLTFSPKSAELLGYTEQEVTTFFAEHLSALAKGYKLSETEMLQKLREQYNGYAFGIDDMAGSVVGSVYNPFALNHVFFQQQLVKQWFISATPSALITKLRDINFETLDPSNLVTSLGGLKASSDPDKITALTLLYYAGYVTLKRYSFDFELVSLDFPNAEVAQAFSEHLLPLITEKPLNPLAIIARSIKSKLMAYEFDELQALFNQALAQLPYHMFGTQESYYQTVFYLLLNVGTSVTFAEDMMNRGRADITVLLPKAVYVFELKMNQPASVALAQIKDRGYAEKYRHLGRQMYAVGIMLSSKKRVIEEIVFESL